MQVKALTEGGQGIPSNGVGSRLHTSMGKVMR